MTVLVVNHGLHQVCGIHDLGLRLYDAIPDDIDKAYAECSDAADYARAQEEHQPSVTLVNYRADLLPWMNDALRHDVTLSVAVAHNYEPHTLPQLAAMHRWTGFDRTLALEPSLGDVEHVVWSGRPMPPAIWLERRPDDAVPYIGTFGFAFPHKRFDLVAREMSDQFYPPAMLWLHCPTAHFGGSPDQTAAVIAAVRQELEDPPQNGYELHLTTDHRPAVDVVAMLAGCDVNCLLYDPGQPDAGLSSALDYLLAAGRPILVSEASMFRHALPAALTWPEHRLADVRANADEHSANVRDRYNQLSQGYVAGIRELLELA